MADTIPGVVDTIGVTPLVRLDKVGAGLPGHIYVKLESRNPGGSVKDRIAKAMLDDAEQRGLITPGASVIVEPTSGNTGIGLALVGATRGYRVILTMPESMSVERRRLLAAFGGELVLTDRAGGMQGAVDKADAIAAELQGAFIPAQFDNPANPRVHYVTTGPEIHTALGAERLYAFVAGVGTGGTVSGCGRFLKEVRPGTLAIAVEPAESPIIGQALAGEPLTPGPHAIQGIGANFIPRTLDLRVLDGVERVDAATAIDVARRLALEEGIFVGISSGAAVAAALRIAARPEAAGAAIVTVAPSTGERELSTPLWEGYGA